MSNEFLNELLALHPELQEEYSSEQYKLSLEIIDLMMSLGLNSKAIARKIGCSHNKYLRMESGDVTISTDEYFRAILKLKALLVSEETELTFNYRKFEDIPSNVSKPVSETVMVKSYHIHQFTKVISQSQPIGFMGHKVSNWYFYQSNCKSDDFYVTPSIRKQEEQNLYQDLIFTY